MISNHEGEVKSLDGSNVRHSVDGLGRAEQAELGWLGLD